MALMVKLRLKKEYKRSMARHKALGDHLIQETFLSKLRFSKYSFFAFVDLELR